MLLTKTKKYLKILGFGLVVFVFSFLVLNQAKATTACLCKVSYTSSGVESADMEKACQTKLGQYTKTTATAGVCLINNFPVSATSESACTGNAEAKTNVEKIIKSLFGTTAKVTVDSISCSVATVESVSASTTQTTNDICKGANTAKALQDCAKAQLNPGSIQTPAQLVGLAIKFLLFFVGGVAMVLYIVAGFIFMTAGGNAERRGKALKTILWVTIGTFIMFASYMIMQFIFNEIILK